MNNQLESGIVDSESDINLQRESFGNPIESLEYNLINVSEIPTCGIRSVGHFNWVLNLEYKRTFIA
jgi:hypothetical protein